MKSEPTTLVILTPGFPADESDGNCLPAQQALVRSINKIFPELVLVILSFQYPYNSSPYYWHGNRVFPLNGQNRGGIARLGTWLRCAGILYQLKKKEKILGLLSFWLGESALIGKYFASVYGLTHRTWLLGQDAKKENRYVRWIRPHAGSLVAISDSVADQFYRARSIRPAHTIPNAIDPAAFLPAVQQRTIDIIGVGSLIPLKRYDLFIGIIAALSKKMAGLRVAIYGDGPEKHKLASLVDAQGLQQVISLQGEKPHEEILSLLQQSRILLHSSEYEGFSGACLEALYAGAHVVSFCQPMNAWLKHWHNVTGKDAAVAMLSDLLSAPDLDHSPSLPYTMDDSARAWINLFTVGD